VRGGNESGAVLLEVIVALAILAIAGTSALMMASESARAVAHVRAQGEALQAASTFMDAVALWPRADLDRRLGVHPQGDWRLRIDRTDRRIYVVTLSDSGGVELIQTSLFRNDSAHASP
jgi:type II secretory pathway pseudopilin PulG